jgi:hypothetical protein
VIRLAFIFLLFITPPHVGNAATCDERSPTDNCTFAPDGWKMTIKAIGLCKSIPSGETSGKISLSDCVYLFDQLNGPGQSIELTGIGDSISFRESLNIPAEGIYPYAFWSYANDMRVKKAWLELSNQIAGLGPEGKTEGRYCWTTAIGRTRNDGDPRPSFRCGDSPADAEYTPRTFYKPNGFERTTCGGVNYWLSSQDGTLADSDDETMAVMVVQKLATPFVVGPNPNPIELSFEWRDLLQLDTDANAYPGEVILSDFWPVCNFNKIRYAR